MLKVTPAHSNNFVKKFYQDGVLRLKSEYNSQNGHLHLVKDVFMNTNGTFPVRISKYDKNEKLIEDTFFKADGEYLASINYKELGNMLDFIL